MVWFFANWTTNWHTADGQSDRKTSNEYKKWTDLNSQSTQLLSHNRFTGQVQRIYIHCVYCQTTRSHNLFGVLRRPSSRTPRVRLKDSTVYNTGLLSGFGRETIQERVARESAKRGLRI